MNCKLHAHFAACTDNSTNAQSTTCCSSWVRRKLNSWDAMQPCFPHNKSKPWSHLLTYLSPLLLDTCQSGTSSHVALRNRKKQYWHESRCKNCVNAIVQIMQFDVIDLKLLTSKIFCLMAFACWYRMQAKTWVGHWQVCHPWTALRLAISNCEHCSDNRFNCSCATNQTQCSGPTETRNQCARPHNGTGAEGASKGWLH